MKRISITLGIALVMFILFNSFRMDDVKKPDLGFTKMQPVSTNIKDQNVLAYLNKMGITVKIDKEAFDQQFPGVDLKVESGSRVAMAFPNETAGKYQLDIYDNDGNPVVTFTDIHSDEVSVDSGFFNEGSYIYKISGEGVLYAGKFDYN